MVEWFNELFGPPRQKRKPRGRNDSIRDVCFRCFSEGQRPKQVLHDNPTFKERTILTYHNQWKKESELTRDPANRVHYNRIYRYLRDPDVRPKLVAMLAEQNHRTPDEIEALLRKPWGLQSAMSGKTKRQLNLESKIARLNSALALVDYCDANDIPLDTLLFHAFRFVDLVQEARGVEDKVDYLAMDDAERKAHDNHQTKTGAEALRQQTEAVRAITAAIKQAKKPQTD